MKLRLMFSAIFSLRNLAVACLAAAGAYLLASGWPAYAIYASGGALLVYAAFVIQSLSSKEFHERFNHRQKIRSIQDLNYSCTRLYYEARKQAGSTYQQKLKKVIDDKSDIINSFFRGERSLLKEKIVEQALNLVVAYIKLLTNYCIRSRELSEMDVGEIANRINMNTRKLNFSRDAGAAEDIKRVIEMDEKIISRLKDERNDLERINVKLDFMEGTVNMLKHQILSHIESEDMLEKMETVVNEASALDSVLQERRKSKIRI